MAAPCDQICTGGAHLVAATKAVRATRSAWSHSSSAGIPARACGRNSKSVCKDQVILNNVVARGHRGRTDAGLAAGQRVRATRDARMHVSISLVVGCACVRHCETPGQVQLRLGQQRVACCVGRGRAYDGVSGVDAPRHRARRCGPEVKAAGAVADRVSSG